MWRNTNPAVQETLRSFERAFHFPIDRDLRAFLALHNGGSPCPGTFPTTHRERKLFRLLDFQDRKSEHSAWIVNKRLQAALGEPYIGIGIDNTGNFLCLTGKQNKQRIVLWLHTTNEFADCLWDIPAFMRYIG